LAGQEIHGLVILNHENYNPLTWRLTLIVFAVVFLAAFFNTFLARRLPFIEGIVLILHICGFFAIIIPLWVLAPRATAHEVFTTFQNAGWSSSGLSTIVGIITPTVALIGSDAACHMSEELQDAAYTLPRAMMSTVILNGALGFVMLLTMCFCIGDLDSVLSSPVGASGMPFIQVFANGVQSNGGATAMTSILIVLSIFCCITNIAAASRQLFAFARDKGVPFSGFFSYVPPGMAIPVPAICVTIVISMLLALIPLGSSIAYNQIVSLGLGALLTSYIICISCLLLRRIRGEPLLPSKFSLGRIGGFAINVFSLCFLSFILVMCFFPAVPNPTPAEMNWAVAIYGVVILLALLYFFVRGRKSYKGPVAYVKKLE
jgi:choline transport protein